MTKMNIKTIIFDLDGTLYDSTGLPKKLALKELSRCALLRIAAERKARKALAGVAFKSEKEFYDRFFSLIAKYSLGSNLKAERWYREQYMHDFVEILRKHFHARKGLNEMVEALKDKGFKVVVFSDYGCVPQKMEALGIRTELFDALLDGPSLGGLKPCKESFEKALAAVGAESSTALMVGDRDDTDGEGARSAGMQFIRIFKSGCPSGQASDDTPYQTVPESDASGGNSAESSDSTIDNASPKNAASQASMHSGIQNKSGQSVESVPQMPADFSTPISWDELADMLLSQRPAIK